MIGAIIGDIVGSVYEWNNIHTKDFPFLIRGRNFVTDDSIMSLAIADAILSWDNEGRPSYERLSQLAVEKMRHWGGIYPHSGYGGHFRMWLGDSSMGPYNSFGNGSAMRVSAVGWAARSLEECIAMSRAVTEVTHNHPDGIMGAESTAVQIFLARQGKSLEELGQYEEEHYYVLDYDMAWLRENYGWVSVCDNTCQPAFLCLYDSTSYEDAIRNCMSIGGDSDTIGAICGGIAEAYWGIPDDLYNTAVGFLDEKQRTTLESFRSRFVCK